MLLHDDDDQQHKTTESSSSSFSAAAAVGNHLRQRPAPMNNNNHYTKGRIMSLLALVVLASMSGLFLRNRRHASLAFSFAGKTTTKTTNTTGLTAADDHDYAHNPSPHASALSSILQSNSTHYTWIGNHFIPPRGVPTFSANDYAAYFGQRNTLWIGDSTGRRAYATLFEIMQSSIHNSNNINATDVPETTLSHWQTIDFNKDGGRTIRIRCNETTVQRSLFQNSKMNFNEFVCRDVETTHGHGDENDSSTTTTTNNNNNNNHDDGTTSPKRKGLFDFLRIDCPAKILDSFADQTTTTTTTTTTATANNGLADYDLLILANGIWEAVRPATCRRHDPEAQRFLTLPEKMELVLDFVTTNLTNATTSRDLQVVYRTPGFHADHMQDDVLWEMIHALKNYQNRAANHTTTSSFPSRHEPQTGVPAKQQRQPHSRRHNHSPRFVVVDWGTVIAKRSFGPDRIRGDLKPHYGTEARLLFAQQLLHELLAADQMTRGNG